MKKFLIIVSIFLTICCIAQKEGQENALFTIRGNIGIPRSISSKMFRTCFNGVYEGNLSLNLKTFSNFFIGVGYQNSHFQNNKEVFVYYRSQNGSLSYNTRLAGHGGFLKLGYDKFFSDKGYLSYSLNSGLMFTKYLNVNEDSSLANRPYVAENFIAPFVQPEVSVNFIVDKKLSFSIMLSYTTMFYRFDPRAPRFAQVQQVREASNHYNISWINIGFGFNILLDKKTKE